MYGSVLLLPPENAQTEVARTHLPHRRKFSKRELNRKISDPKSSKEELCALAQQAATELYQCFQGYNYAYESERIRRLLRDSNPSDEAFPSILFHNIVSRVFLETSTHLTLLYSLDQKNAESFPYGNKRMLK